MKKILLFVIAILSINIFTQQAYAKTKEFSDLSTKNPHYESIMKLVDKGVMSGYADGAFLPERTISRKQVASIINKEFPQLIIHPYIDVNKLADVPKNDSAYNAIKKLYKSSLMSAFYNKADGKSYFKPNNPITRAELALIISQAYGYYDYYGDMKQHKFADEKEFLEQKKMINALHAHKIMNSFPDNTFRPNEPITRAQFASILVRAQENMSEAHRQMYNLAIYKYEEPKNVPLPKGVTNAKALKKQQEALFKDNLKTKSITVLKGWRNMFVVDYQFSYYIKLYSERFNLTEKEFVALINRLVETGEVYTGIIDDLNEFRMYYDFEDGRLYQKEPGGV
ncbi:S-layer homology domain-containing protein [Solibacillus silvestris]|uniref:S-layer homology domain-containing protein n=1 Tax=Solibacillus silvestris TaxID=76853 RepID=UPI003F7CF72C